MSTQTIEFASNSSNNWFCVAYTQEVIDSIVAKATELGIRATSPKFYEANSKAPARFLSYFNGQDTKELYRWAISQFKVKNTSRKTAAERTEEAEILESAKVCQRANISRYSLPLVKKAMIKVIGSPEEIRDAFENYNIKVVGVAGLPQCLRLIENLDKGDEVLHLLRTLDAIETYPSCELPPSTPLTCEVPLPELHVLFNAVDEIVAKPIYQDAIVPYFETVEAEIVDDDEIDIDLDSEEFELAVIQLIGAYIGQLALSPVTNKNTSDFEPWTVAELSAYTIKEIKELAALDGISLVGTSKMRKSDLIQYILPAINKAALAAHLA
jgi:hypothetical protein